MSNENKEPQQQHPAPDPRHAEAQLYQRIEQARVKIYGLINQIIKDTGLPTAIILEVLRGVTAETTLALEKMSREAVLKEMEGLKKAGKKEAKNGEAKNGEANP